MDISVYMHQGSALDPSIYFLGQGLQCLLDGKEEEGISFLQEASKTSKVATMILGLKGIDAQVVEPTSPASSILGRAEQLFWQRNYRDAFSLTFKIPETLEEVEHLILQNNLSEDDFLPYFNAFDADPSSIAKMHSLHSASWFLQDVLQSDKRRHLPISNAKQAALYYGLPKADEYLLEEAMIHYAAAWRDSDEDPADYHIRRCLITLDKIEPDSPCQEIANLLKKIAGIPHRFLK